jgi:hypothetical protein
VLTIRQAIQFKPCRGDVQNYRLRSGQLTSFLSRHGTDFLSEKSRAASPRAELQQCCGPAWHLRRCKACASVRAARLRCSGQLTGFLSRQETTKRLSLLRRCKTCASAGRAAHGLFELGRLQNFLVLFKKYSSFLCGASALGRSVCFLVFYFSSASRCFATFFHV